MAVQVRKTVTVLFADVVGSTELGEAFDAEATRTSLDRYFAATREILERHGGTVEKFIGDAVMAVFGIPELHEDDALRAVRAAVQLRDRLATLELAVPLRIRVGVTTGEVVAGEGETFATGDAVNVAGRLEAAAAPGEILIGTETHALVAAAVEAEAVEPLELKGKTDRVGAYRLRAVLAGAPAFTRRLDTKLVGREHELRTLADRLAAVRQSRRCDLAVVAGEAGIGKSRLVRELVQVTDARVLVGRCLSYGDGITYWPLREIVQQIGEAELRRLVDDGAVDAVLGAVGLAPPAAQSTDIHWSIRRLVEEMARTRPLLLVLDDLHWAESLFLDLVDYLHGFVRDAPVLLVATGRPELFDARPAWRTGAIELVPLGADESAGLVEQLGGGLPAALRAQVVETAEGNPLFLEQLVAAGGDGVGMPPTIRAFLTARIDALPSRERAIAECGAVEGRLFHRGAVQELVGEDALAGLLSLVRRELVRPDESLFPGDDGFRFAHALIRDAAYEAAPKSRRAELHEGYAAWLRRASEDADEIVAYHLEQAALLAAEVGAPRSDLAREAGLLLTKAALRAYRRGDVAATVGLVTRAVAVLEPSAERAEALALQAEAAVHVGNVELSLAAARAVLDDPETDELVRARATIGDALGKMLSAVALADDVRAELETAIERLRAVDDEWWVARGLLALANTFAGSAQFGPCAGMLEEAFALQEAMDDPALRGELLFWVGAALMHGPVPVPVARERVEALRVHVQTPLEQAWLEFPLGVLAALSGEFDVSRRLFATSRGAMQEAGAQVYYAANSMHVGHCLLIEGDAVGAAEVLRDGWEILGSLGERGLRSTVGTTYAWALYELGLDEQAETIAREARALTLDDDATTQCYYRIVLARLRARAGRLDEAAQLARDAVDWALRTDSAWHHIDAYRALAEVTGDEDAAAEAARLVDAHGAVALRAP